MWASGAEKPVSMIKSKYRFSVMNILTGKEIALVILSIDSLMFCCGEQLNDIAPLVTA